jgi:hypothetical protein
MQCKLSYANSFVNAVQGHTDINAEQNARLVVNTVKKYVSIKTIKNIKPHEEIFIDYGGYYQNVPLSQIHLSGDSQEKEPN